MGSGRLMSLPMSLIEPLPAATTRLCSPSEMVSMLR
jgi:hypothetical protein